MGAACQAARLEEKDDVKQATPHSFGEGGNSALQMVQCEDTSPRELDALLISQVKESRDSDMFGRTLTAVSKLLADGIGGMIIAVLHEDLCKKNLAMDTLDAGLHTEVFQQLISNIHNDFAIFKQLLAALCSHSASDRWEHEDVENLAHQFPQAAGFVGKLEGQPKDGAILLGHRGTVKGVSLHLKYQSARYQLVKPNKKAAGTRHASALGFAEWLGGVDERTPGVVFARSDAGGACAFLPRRPDKKPAVYSFRTWSIPTQQDMLTLFRDRIMKEGKLMRKDQPALIRPGRKGEHVVTLVNGRMTSEVVIEDDTSMVVRASTMDQEQYVLNKQRFEANWQTEGVDLPDLQNFNQMHKFMQTYLRQLKARGFRLHKPRADLHRWIYELKEKDLELLPTGCFASAWGPTQPARLGDFLAMPAPSERATEVYLMPANVVTSYVEVELETSGENYLTQSEMLDLFQDRIREHGKLMSKTRPAPIRPGKRGERVFSVVEGKITSDVVIQDDTSMVVRSPLHQELYVLPRQKFEDSYEPVPRQLVGKGPVERLLRSQGYHLYKPKARNRKFIYELTPDDMKQIPNGLFVASWGALQKVKAGDHIAMPALQEDETDKMEVYYLPDDIYRLYSADEP